MRVLAVSIFASVVVALAPGRAAAQEQLAPTPAAGGPSADLSVADKLRLQPYFLLGFGGEADAGGASGDLDPTVGLGARFEAPVYDYIVVGGLLEWATFKLDLVDDRDHLLDIDAFVKGRYVLDAGGMPLELYALLPVGFSAAFFDSALADDTAIGWNLGLMFGGTLFVSDSIGVFAEIGFMHHGLTLDTGAGEVDVDANQARLNLGAAFAF